MAIRDDNTPPSKPGSITQSADEQIDRIGNVSNVSRTVSTMQKDVKQQITETKQMVDESEGISSVQNSMSKVLDKLSDTIGALSQGVKTITVDTAKATKDAIGDYGKAISADISFNKQSVVAMALARSTPIYGYFVAKFMETDVFKRAAEKMKTSIGKAFGSLAGIFRRDAKTGKQKRIVGKIPHMARGGYVEKEGVAKIHAGEVVMPIEKILSRMDESTSITKNVSKILTKLTLQQATSTTSMHAMVMGMEDQKGGKRVGLIKDVLKLAREGKERYKDPLEVRQLRELIAIRESLGGELKVWPEVWSKLLMKHPGFRNMMAITKLMGKFALLIHWKPVYALFKSRGGYGSYLSKSSKPLNALNQNMGTHFVESMWRYDNMLNLLKAIAIATRDTAATITGKKYGSLKGVGTGTWSVAGAAARLAGLVTGAAMKGLGKIPGLGFMGKGGKALTRKSLTGRYGSSYSLGESGGTNQIGEIKKVKSKRNRMFDMTEAYFKNIKKRQPIVVKQQKLLTSSAVDQVTVMKKVQKKLKSNWLIKYLLLGWGIIKGFINKLWGGMSKNIFRFLKFGKGKFASMLGLNSLGKFGAPKGQKGAIGRFAGKIPPGMKKVMGAGGIAAGVAMGVYDAMQAVQMADKWKTSKTSAGIGGFLGGTGSGMSGALKGAGKGAMLGAGIGSFVPVIGTAIGGAVGAIAGGIMGFVGGKNLAKGFDAMGGYIKKLAIATWNLVKSPFKMMGMLWDKVKEQFTLKKLGEHSLTAISLVWKFIKLPYKLIGWLMKKIAPETTAKVAEVYDWITSKISFENIKKIIKAPVDMLFNTFSWIGGLFGKIKNYVVEGISKIPFIGRFMKKGDKPGENKGGGIKDTVDAGAEAAKGATKGWWNKAKSFWKSDEPKDLAKQAQKGAEDAIKKSKNATSSVINKMNPKAREAFETAKKYYMKEFGWTEAQADAVLQTIAATAGDKLDLFSDPAKLKGMASGMYKSAGGNIKDRYLASIDKGKIIVNQASLMLANGELIADDLGKKIVESSKELGKQTLQGAGAVVSTVQTAVTNSNVTNNSSVSSGSKSSGPGYFDHLVYTGNYR